MSELVPTFAVYYESVAGHDWFKRVVRSESDQFATEWRAMLDTHIDWVGYDLCNSCSSTASVFTLFEGSVNRMCLSCTQRKLFSIYAWMFDSLSNEYPTFELRKMFFPQEFFPDVSGERNMCKSCDGVILTEADVSASPSSASFRYVGFSGDEFLHTKCVFMCATCEVPRAVRYTETYNVDGKSICRECMDAISDWNECDWCSDRFTGDMMWSDDRDCEVCQYCADSSWECRDCGYDRYDGDSHSCYRESDSLIYEYSYKPNPQFYGKADYYFGFELEVEDDGGNGTERGAEIVNDYLGNRVYCKHDGSLNNGFEIVSHPHSLEELQRINLDVLDRLRELGYRSWNTDTCGIHIHISRTAFIRGRRHDSAHELRFQKLIYDNRHHVQAIAGRVSDFAKFNDRGHLVEKVKFGHQADRYEAVNSYNNSTLEVRVFRGSLRKQRLLSSVEFLHSAVEYTRNMKINPKDKQLSWVRFLAYVLDNQEKYPNFTQVAMRAMDNFQPPYQLAQGDE